MGGVLSPAYGNHRPVWENPTVGYVRDTAEPLTESPAFRAWGVSNLNNAGGLVAPFAFSSKSASPLLRRTSVKELKELTLVLYLYQGIKDDTTCFKRRQKSGNKVT